MKRKLVSLMCLCLAVLLSFAPMAASAFFLTGDEMATYTVTDSETHVLGEGLTYNEYSYTDSNGIGQTCFVMEFNPKTSDFRPYVYHSQASHGYTIAEDAENAWESGLEVYAAINGDFFSMDTNNYGTPIGFYGTNGAITCTTVGMNDNALVFKADGTADVTRSYLGFTVDIGGADYSSAFRYVNKRTINNENGIYYFDAAIGKVSPFASTAERTEILCDITSDYKDLQIGETLTATVSKVNTHGATAFTPGEQFVLSANMNLDLSGVEVGDSVSITVTEQAAESKEIMENCSHFIYARYVLVHDGVRQTINDPGMSEIYAQRCVVGVKADGTLIYMVSDGRKVKGNGANGLTFSQILDVMEEYDCQEVVNLDGGGSTAVVLSEGDGKFNYEFIGEGTGRPVANSVLIVRDPNADKPALPEYVPIVDNPDEELRNVALNKAYSVEWNGIMAPTYLSGTCGDKYGLKVTNGRYRTADDASDRHSIVYVGQNSNVTYKFDLESAQKLRSVTFVNAIVSNFKTDNVIVYVSDDGINWSSSVDYDLSSKKSGVAGTRNIICTFKEEKVARYVKVVIGTPSGTLTLDEVEINAMVNKNLPVEQPAPEDPRTLPAETPSEYCNNVALGCGYTLLCNGAVPNPSSGEIPRYYAVTMEEKDPQRLTDGKVGLAGNYNDGATLGIYSGANKEIEITLDLGEVKENLEFVQMLNMINNGASFGHANTAIISLSNDGTTFTPVEARENLTVRTNTQYYSLTFQFLEKMTARYISVKITTEKALFGLGELTVLQAADEYTVTFVGFDGESLKVETVDKGAAASAPEAPVVDGYNFIGWDVEFDVILGDTTVKAVYEKAYTYGDVNGDNKVSPLDASLVLQYNAKLIKELAFVEAADVNGDGKITPLDASLILQYNAKLILEFPAAK